MIGVTIWRAVEHLDDDAVLLISAALLPQAVSASKPRLSLQSCSFSRPLL
jgi:hypothetical protein